MPGPLGYPLRRHPGGQPQGHRGMPEVIRPASQRRSNLNGGQRQGPRFGPDVADSGQGGAGGAAGPASAPGSAFWKARPAHAGPYGPRPTDQDSFHRSQAGGGAARLPRCKSVQLVATASMTLSAVTSHAIGFADH
jgi:hypothetical protein